MMFNRSSRGFTLLELCLLLFTLFILFAVFYPMFSTEKHKSVQSSCASNMKQIGLALIGYTQDYDEKLPPCLGAIRLSDGKLYEQQWGPSYEVMIAGKRTPVPAIIDGWVKNHQIFRCPSVKKSQSGLTYLYSDLAATESIADISNTSITVISAEGDDHLRNVGHAKSQNKIGEQAELSPRPNAKSPKLLIGAAVGDASIRHSEGGNYCFADGHVKWMKPENVFFPSRNSNSHSYREAKTGTLLGPDPAGKRVYQGKVYAATFHLR